MSILRCESLARTYVSGGREITVLRDITFELEAGGFLAITGPSGSGKSTLLGLLAGLDRPTRGRVLLDGRDLAALTEDERARVRAEAVGFVFQSFHLIPTLTARENVQVPLELRGEDGRARADELLERVGLGDRGHHYPAQLSGGEQQRVAVARAFAHRPQILFADEPTGNLDAANGQNVVALLGELNRELGTTLVLVTHDPDLAARARRVLRLRDGAVVEDSARGGAGHGRPRGRAAGAGSASSSPSPGARPGPRAGGACSSCWRWRSAWPPSSRSTRSPTTCASRCAGRPGRCSAPTSSSRRPDRSRATPRSSSPSCAARRAPPAEVARVVTFGAMALRPGGETTRLVQVLAVDPGYPFYGVDRDRARRRVGTARRDGRRGRRRRRCSSSSGPRSGDEIALGEARFVLRATVAERAGRRGRAQRLRPARLHPPRPGAGDRPADPGLAGRATRPTCGFPPEATPRSSPTASARGSPPSG